MFKKILIANRGEIALRIIRTCKEMGIKTVSVYSEGDEESIHVHMADQSICIGPSQSQKSYLNMDSIISAALVSGADAIHPGYGFLSENKDFVKKCNENNLVFIGPKAEHIEIMGNKSMAREKMIEAKVPVVAGSLKSTNRSDQAYEEAKEIGYPIMIKAANGGGGRGMRIVHKEEDFIDNFNMAKSEAKAAFGDDLMYLERFLENPRHIEFQILADSHGNLIHLGERDCSIQRRNQKVLEEAPCNILSEELREEMGQTALRAAKEVGYESAGTVEFLLDGQDYFFIEMNTRIQVEHPVTEYISGVDLIREQIRIAAGEKLDLKQEDIILNGNAIECRINAEDPSNNFMPSPGRIEKYLAPGGFGIRVDSHIYDDYTIPAYYDSMIGKVISWGRTREEAIIRMERALDEMLILGINSNIDFLKTILKNENFRENKIDTSFIEKEALL